MAQPAFTLDHINMPARDPHALARWYADTFGLTADEHRVRGPGVLMAFELGEPVQRSPELHIGLRVESGAILKEWAAKFNAEIHTGVEFAAFRTHDPDGNCVELYCRVGT
jgi:catechol 2,3-dioxygenase-like lactoylglutathione lyase family enzyme